MFKEVREVAVPHEWPVGGYYASDRDPTLT